MDRQRAAGGGQKSASARLSLAQQDVGVSMAKKSQRRCKICREKFTPAFENHRWFDLIRTGRAVEVMKSKGFSLNETNLICPIPQKQIDVNPKLTQNDYRIESRN